MGSTLASGLTVIISHIFSNLMANGINTPKVFVRAFLHDLSRCSDSQFRIQVRLKFEDVSSRLNQYLLSTLPGQAGTKKGKLICYVRIRTDHY